MPSVAGIYDDGLHLTEGPDRTALLEPLGKGVKGRVRNEELSMIVNHRFNANKIGEVQHGDWFAGRESDGVQAAPQ